jgi:SET domain
VPPTRAVEWIQHNGMCIDNIRIKTATNPLMGRGAFAAYSLSKGAVVAPMPLQLFMDRSKFAAQKPEALFVNYCFTHPSNEKLMLFPYGPGINLINHGSLASGKANVAVRWSNHHMNHKHWLSLSWSEMQQMDYPGGLLMEVYTLRDIRPDEELFMDYGRHWEEAWEAHVKSWQPVPGAKDYVYPADMDDKAPLLTLEEQATKPNPSNLQTACYTPNWSRKPGSVMNWTKPEFDWPEGLMYCNILKREKDAASGEDLYTVSLNFERLEPDWDLGIAENKRYIDVNVPRWAISWVDRPYKSDLHLANAFRHPIGIPDDVLPKPWRMDA